MRRQTIIQTNRIARDNKGSRAHKRVVPFLKTTGMSLKNIITETNVEQTIVYNIKRYIEAKNEKPLSELLDPFENRAEWPLVLFSDEEKMICERMMLVAKKGFAMSVDNVRWIIRQVAVDGRRRIPKVYRSPDVIRKFQSSSLRDNLYEN